MAIVDPSSAHVRLTELDAVARLFARDVTLFSTEPDVQATVGRRLGWLDVAAAPQGWIAELTALAHQIRASGVHRVVLCGMGGSSLAPEVLAGVVGAHGDGLPLSVLDSTHPAAVERALAPDLLADALVVVASKSGTTEETRDLAALAAERVGPDQLLAITDPGSELDRLATAEGWRGVQRNPADIGGRYSALSRFGMVPAALMGLDVAAMWRASAAQLEACMTLDRATNSAARLAAFAAGYALGGRDKLTLLTPLELAPLGGWIEQLVAESTGKEGRGIVPVVGESGGPYGDDRTFVALRLSGVRLPEEDEVEAEGHPVLALDVARGAPGLAAEFVRWEVATALAGVLLEVDPFDEPNVSESKRNTAAVLSGVADGDPLPEPREDELALEDVIPPDYVAIQAFVDPTSEMLDALERLRAAVRAATGAACTVGIGPRFLHSTGQIHKGGPDTVVAVQLVDPVAEGPDVPGRDFDFATLLRAQAAGDLASLEAHGLRTRQRAVRTPSDVTRLAEDLGA